MKLRRLHWVLLGAGALVAALVGWFWLIQTAASSGLASGVAGSLAEVSAVQQHVLASGYVEAASVQLGQNMDPSGSTRYLNVNTIWRGEPESPAAAVTVAGLVLESHPRIDDLNRVTIGIGKQVRFGPFFHFNQNQAFSRSPAEWEALVARGPGRPKVVPAPEIGAVVLENALLTAGPAQAATCPTRRAGRQFGRDGLQLRVAGRCDDATGALIGQSFAGVTIPDGEVSVEVRVSDGLERAAVRLWTRFTPNASGYFALLEPGRGRAALYRWSGGQQFTLLAERSVEPRAVAKPGRLDQRGGPRAGRAPLAAAQRAADPQRARCQL